MTNIINFCKKNSLTIIIILMFLILVFKELISLYITPVITLIPTFIIFFWFLINFFQRKIKIKAYDLLYGTMIISGVISGIINQQNIIAIIYQIKSLGIYYLLFMIMRDTCLTKKDSLIILKTFNITTVVLVLLSIVEIIFNKNVLFPYSWAEQIVYQDNYIRAYSFLYNPNLFGFFLIYILLYNYKYGEKNIVLYTLIITGIILSISRSALICLIVVIFTYLISLIIKRKKQKILKEVISLALIFLISITSTKIIYYVRDIVKMPTIVYFDNKVDNKKDDKTGETKVENFEDRISLTFSSKFLNDSLTNGRLATVIYGLKVWKKSPIIGTGLSSFLTASSFLNPNLEDKMLELEYSDNQYIALLVETGLLGIITFITAFSLLTFEHIKQKKYTLILSTFVIIFFGLFINCLEVQLIAFLYFMYLSNPVIKINKSLITN